MKLTDEFYRQKDVVKVARALLGKKLCTLIGGVFTSGIITETEAYNGIHDRACHAFGGKLTKRTATMYEPGGVAYVYLCYGMHHLFNVVTGTEGVPTAVLIRAVMPADGVDAMLQRRNKTQPDKTLTLGPGSMSRALGISTALNGESLSGKKIWVEDAGLRLPAIEIVSSARIGVEYAAEDALLPYRFVWQA